MTRRVLITGVCGGVGRATAALFRDQGWTTVGVDHREPPAGLEVDEFISLDVSSADVWPLIAEIARGDRLDALVNNAAMQIEKRLVDTDSAAWDDVLMTNVRGPFLATKGAADALRRSHGSVVNVSSVHAVATSPGVAAYATSKGALAAFTRAAALELAPEVRVNAVLPGAVDTPMLRAGIARWVAPNDVDAALQALAARTPLGRIGDPVDIAQTILFLADADRSSFITGQTIVADGGVTARLSSEP